MTPKTLSIGGSLLTLAGASMCAWSQRTTDGEIGSFVLSIVVIFFSVCVWLGLNIWLLAHRKKKGRGPGGKMAIAGLFFTPICLAVVLWMSHKDLFPSLAFSLSKSSFESKMSTPSERSFVGRCGCFSVTNSWRQKDGTKIFIVDGTVNGGRRSGFLYIPEGGKAPTSSLGEFQLSPIDRPWYVWQAFGRIEGENDAEPPLPG